MSMKLTQNDFDRLVVFMKKNYGINLEKKSVLIEGRLSNMIAGFRPSALPMILGVST